MDGSKHLRTTDGGHTWAKLSGASASDVYFLTVDEGFVAGYLGVSSSTDGGYNWSTPDCFDDSTLRGVSFVNSIEGWAVGDGKILYTADSGQTWEMQRDDDFRLRDVHFVNQSHGWAVGRDGSILATINGGSAWTLQTAGTNYTLHDVDFVDDSYGWIAGAETSYWGDGRVWRTIDGGVHWVQAGHFSGYDDRKFAIDFVDRNVGYVAGEEGKDSPGSSRGSIYRTTDGGETWTKKSLGGDYSILRSLDFISANEGWAVGEKGFIAHTTDGGDSWELQASGTGRDLSAVSFLNNRDGYAVGGDNGSIVLKTTDGGVTWVEEITGSSYRSVHDISLPDSHHAWIVGSSGMIRAYTDPNMPTPTPTPTATPTVTPTRTPTPTLTPTPWLNWREPDQPLLLPPRGATVDVLYGNISAPATLTATLSGPATFADGSQALTTDITDTDGIYALHLQPAAGAILGDSFTLEVTLAGLRIERAGAIASELYLPLIRKGVP